MFQSLQICRGLAAILVLLFHCSGNLAKEKYFGFAAEPLKSLFYFGGSSGVAFFFVLSGFIISYVHWQDINQPKKVWAYFSKRIIRVYPIYILIFCAVYLAAYAMPSLRDTTPNDWLLILKSLLLVPQDKALVGGTGVPVIVVAWSLQYELFFYLAFAVAILSIRFFIAFVAVFLVAYLASQFLNITYAFPWSFFTSYYVLLFCMGLLITVSVKSKFNMVNPKLWFLLSAVAFFIVSTMQNMYGEVYSSQWFFLAYGLSSTLMIYSLVKYETNQPNILQKGLLTLLGDASYVIYLIHFPLVSAMSKVLIIIFAKTALNAFIAFMIITMTSIVVGVAFHLLIEKPMLKKLNTMSKKYILA